MSIKNFTSAILSAGAAAASTVAAAEGDPTMQKVYFWLNVAILISNTALSIYRTWRDRDKDKKKGKGEK